MVPLQGVRAAAPRSAVKLSAAPANGCLTTITKNEVPLKLEEGEMPMNTFNNKAPFVAKIRSVERIVGPKATGETCHIIIETEGNIPFWEG